MTKDEKLQRDRETVEKYEEQLRARRKEYGEYAEALSLTGRKNRAAAVGECVLQLLDHLAKLNNEKKLINGSLFWGVREQRVKDTDGKKGFRYTVYWRVKSDEPMYTEAEIRKETDETMRRMYEETEEMYAEPEEDEDPEKAEEPAGEAREA